MRKNKSPVEGRALEGLVRKWIAATVSMSLKQGRAFFEALEKLWENLRPYIRWLLRSPIVLWMIRKLIYLLLEWQRQKQTESDDMLDLCPNG